MIREVENLAVQEVVPLRRQGIVLYQVIFSFPYIKNDTFLETLQHKRP